MALRAPCSVLHRWSYEEEKEEKRTSNLEAEAAKIGAGSAQPGVSFNMGPFADKYRKTLASLCG